MIAFALGIARERFGRAGRLERDSLYDKVQPVLTRKMQRVEDYTVNLQAPQIHESVRWAVLAAAEKVLRPLARLMLSHRIPFSAFVTVAKRAFVSVANNEFNIERRSQTKSRIAMLTGLTRMDVHSVLWDPQYQGLPDLTRGCRPSAVIEGWRTDSFFQDDSGEPMELAPKGKGRSFETLVRRYGADVPPKTMLEELARSGTVEYTDDGNVRLAQRAFLPRGRGSTEQAQLLGSAAEKLLDTGVRNMLNEGAEDAPYLLQQQIFTVGLPPHKVNEFREDLRELLERHLTEIYDYVEAHEERPAQEGYHHTAGVGVYYFED